MPIGKARNSRPSGLHTEVRHDEIDVRIFLDKRNPLRRNTVGAITGMQLDEHTQFPAFVERWAQPVLGTVRPICMHIGLQLDHAETMLLHIALNGLDPFCTPQRGL